MVDKSNEYGFVPSSPTQARGSNTGIFEVNDVVDLLVAEQWSGDFGQLELIETQTASSDAYLDFTSLGNYNVHFLTVNNYQANTDNTILTIKLFESGVLETASVYHVAIQGGRHDGTFTPYQSTASPNGIVNIGSGIDNGPNSSANGYCYLYNLIDNTKYSFSTFQFSYIYYTATELFEMNYGSGGLYQVSAVDGFRIIPNGGTFSGSFSLYGVTGS